MSAVAAVEAALTLSRDPSLASVMRKSRLPDGVGVLLQILAGEAEVARSVAETSRCDERALVMAAEYFVQAVMLYRGAPAERVLGVAPGATRAQMRSHMRLLLVWLHPDRSGDDWRAAFARRVLDAWRDVNGETYDPAPVEPIQAPVQTYPRAPGPRSRKRRGSSVRLRWIPQDVNETSARLSHRARYVLLGAALVAALVGTVYVATMALLAPSESEAAMTSYGSGLTAPAARPQAP